jgi:hypothetical protein
VSTVELFRTPNVYVPERRSPSRSLIGIAPYLFAMKEMRRPEYAARMTEVLTKQIQ